MNSRMYDRSRATRAVWVCVLLTALPIAGVRAQGAVVQGVVFDSIRAEPLSDAVVFLWDTPHRSTTDADGRYRIEHVPPGDYSVVFFHTRLGEVGASVGPRAIRLEEGDSLLVDLATPSMFTLVSSRCMMEEHEPGTGVVAGWVGDGESGLGLPGAQVTLSWDVRGASNPGRLHLRTDESGWYLTCAAPASTPISASARFLDRQALLREVRVSEHGEAEAGFLLFELQPTRILGRLVDGTTGGAVEDAVVWLRGTSIRALTDGRGRFDMRDVPPGTYMLMTDHIAYGTKMDTLEVPSGHRLEVAMRVDPRAIEIEPVSVVVESMRATERAMGGIQIGPDQISKVRHLARDAADLLRSQNIPGVIVRRRGDGSLCIGYAPGQVRMMFNSGCVPMMIFLNDARASNSDMVLRLPPDAVDRMVIYKPWEAGNLFGLGAGNGVLVIYTKGN